MSNRSASATTAISARNTAALLALADAIVTKKFDRANYFEIDFGPWQNSAQHKPRARCASIHPHALGAFASATLSRRADAVAAAFRR
jgi:hypothetical protein